MIVLGEGMGGLEAATRRMCGFGDALDGGVPCHDSLAGFGDRAKLGILKTSFWFDCGTSCGVLPLVLSFLSAVLAGLPIPMPSKTWCIEPPAPGLLLGELLHRPQMGRRGRPWWSISYHTHCPHRQQSTKT